MGFGAGIYVYPKYKNVTYDQMKAAEHIADYDTSEWGQKNFDNAVAYAKYNMATEKEAVVDTVTEDMVDYYRSKMKQNEYGYNTISTEYASWCSNGAGDIYDAFHSLAKDTKDYDAKVFLTRENVYEMLGFFWEKLSKELPEPAIITHSFIYKDNEEDEESDYDNRDIVLKRCEGVEIQFEDGLIKRLDTGEYDYGFCAIKDTYYDEWTSSGYRIGMDACIKLLKEVDFENNFVVYSGGW